MHVEELNEDIQPPHPGLSAHAVIEVKEHAQLIEATPLNYLKGMSPENIIQLCSDYNKSVTELDAILEENKNIYRFFYFYWFFATTFSVGLFAYFPIVTASAGFQSIANEFESNADVPYEVNNSVGIPLVIATILFYLSVFSISDAAIKSTLFHALRKPLLETVSDELMEACQHPCKAMTDTLTFIIEQAILMPSNLTGVVTELVFLPLDYTQWYGKLFASFTLFEGLEWYRQYSNVEYYEGIDFFKNKAKLPWIFLERHFTTTIQAVTQELATIVTTAFPYYYFVSIQAQQTLGLWFPAEMTVSCKSLHCVFTLSPATYHFYMDDYLELKKHFRRQEGYEAVILTKLKELSLEDTAQNREQAEQLLLIEAKNKHQAELVTKYKWLFLYVAKNDLPTGLLVLVRSLLGMYLGYGLGLSLNSEVAEGFLMPALFLVLGKLLYHAELERLVYSDLRQKLMNHIPKPFKTDWLANFLNVTGNGVNAISSVGTLQLLIGNDSPQITFVITLLLTERMLNSITFNKHRLKETIKTQYETLPPVTSCCATLYRKNTRAVLPAPTEIELTTLRTLQHEN